MDVKDALEFVDRLVYAKTGKHLNDLERKVFIGSWAGQTYETIHPQSPEYIDRNVGYRLWQTLTTVLGERVTKKRLQGAVERSFQRQQRLLISHLSQDPDRSLATYLHDQIRAMGYESFIVDVDAIAHPSFSQNGVSHIEVEFKRCHYFLLVLSPQAAVSEMVIEELRRLWDLRGSGGDRLPTLLLIRIGSDHIGLNHDLRHYLRGSYQCHWQIQADTDRILHGLKTLMQQGTMEPPLSPPSVDWLAIPPPFEILSLESDLPVEESHPPDLSPALPSVIHPQPVADPELPKGQVRLASAFYVERVPYETQCYDEIGRPGALIRIKAPRQMGKTSLMARILYQAREKGYRAIPISFQHADREVFTNLSDLLRWLCTKVARKLHLPDRMDTFWLDTYGSKDNCTTYFEDYLLPEIDTPLVLGFDEVDCVFQYPKIADDFFGLLRAWYEEASYGTDDSELWEKLRLVVVHSTEVYIPLDVNQSPFNVGLPIELTEFSPDQVMDLAHRHGLHWQSSQVQQLMTLIGGHPYLVRRAFHEIAQQQLTLGELIREAPTEGGIYGDHLRRQLWNLQQHPDLARAFSMVLHTTHPVVLNSEQAFKLHSLGLVRLEGNGVIPSFDLYCQYFGDRL